MYYKYLKYKKKYLELCDIKSQLIGSGLKTAKEYFINRLYVDHSIIITDPNILKFIEMDDITFEQSRDPFIKENKEIIKLGRINLKKNKLFDKVKENIKNDIKKKLLDIPNIEIFFNNNKIALEELFNILYEKLQIIPNLNNYIDFIIKSYIDNTFGIPSSLENINKFIEAIKNYNKLKNHSTTILLNELNGLVGLEAYISNPEIKRKLDDIIKKEILEERKRARHLMLKEKGGTEPIFKTANIEIYNPKTEDESKYYGSRTKWCTAGDKDCTFNEYNIKGPLYIIINKKKDRKFQLHLQSDVLMDEYDIPISVLDMLKIFKDDISYKKFVDYLGANIIFDGNLIINNTKLNLIIAPFNNIQISFPNQDMYISFRLRLILEENKEKLNNIKILEIYNFNSNEFYILNIVEFLLSYSGLINLDTLIFANNFNQPLGTSLNKSVNLKILNLGNSFNKPLGNSLDNLINLISLDLGNSFSQEYIHIIPKLPNLKIIKKNGIIVYSKS